MVAWLAIAGIPPFSGFWSKDEILVSAFDPRTTRVWIIGTIAAMFTALYMTRLIFMTFFGNARFGSRRSGRVPVVSGGSDDGDAAVLDADDRRPRADDDDAEFEPTVQFGEPPRHVAPARARAAREPDADG